MMSDRPVSELPRLVARLLRTYVAAELWRTVRLAWSLAKDDPAKVRAYLQERKRVVEGLHNRTKGLRGRAFSRGLSRALFSGRRQRITPAELELLDGALDQQPGRVQSLVEIVLSTLRPYEGPAGADAAAPAPLAAPVWVIYDGPRFFPQGFATRQAGRSDFFGAPDLAGARAQLPAAADLQLLPRELSQKDLHHLIGDDPDAGSIVELWTFTT